MTSFLLPFYLFTRNLGIFFNLSHVHNLSYASSSTSISFSFSLSFTYSSREKSWNTFFFFFAWKKSSLHEDDSRIRLLVFHRDTRRGNYLKSRRPRDYHKEHGLIRWRVTKSSDYIITWRRTRQRTKQRRDQYDAFSSSIHDSPRIVTHT